MPTGYTVDEEKKRRIIEAHVKHKVSVSDLAKGYNVNRKTIYKWLKGAEGKENTMADKKPTTPAEEEKATEQSSADAPKEETTTSSETVDDEKTEEATNDPAEEPDCPNPSCDAKFSGDECPNCGYKYSAMVYPFGRPV